MNLYFDVSDLCDPHELMDRVDTDNYRYSTKVKQTIYMFVAFYSAHVLRNVIDNGLGEGFVTFVPPNPMYVMEEMGRMWPRDSIVDMKICFDTIDLQSVVRFNNVHSILDHALARHGKTIESIRGKNEVSVDCSPVGNSFIRLECK